MTIVINGQVLAAIAWIGILYFGAIVVRFMLSLVFHLIGDGLGRLCSLGGEVPGWELPRAAVAGIAVAVVVTWGLFVL
jgi:hypothetical protein